MNNKMWLVVAREYRTNVQKKSFWISILLGPLFFGVLITIQILSATMAPEVEKKVILVDRSGQVAGTISEVLAANKFKNGKQEFQVDVVAPAVDTTAQYTALGRQVGGQEVFGFLLVGDSLESSGTFRFYTRNVGNEMALDKIDDAVEKALVGVRLRNQNVNLTHEQLEMITKGVRLATYKVNDKGNATQKSIGGTLIAAVVFTLILMMTILTYGIAALRSILEEKSSRIIEVLLSSVTPFQLMMGKIVGACLVGLTQVAIYALAGTAASAYGLSSGPPGLARDIVASFSPMMMVYFLIYFLLGFFLFVSMFAAVGSLVNSEQEAQHMQTPVMFALIIPIYAMFFFINNPDSTLARIVSFIPIFTPTVMMMRIAVLTPPLWEIALSIVVLFLATLAVVWIVSRIFRIGILMYGKRPSLPEILRWVKAG
jgi:ABC-2 type transport system permease protein